MSYQFDFHLNHGKVFLDPSTPNLSENKKEFGLTRHNIFIAKIMNVLAKIGIGEGTIEIQNKKNKIERVSIKDVKNLIFNDSSKHSQEILKIKNKEEILSTLYAFYNNKKLDSLTIKANQGDGKAAFELGKIHPSEKLAVDYLEKAAIAGIAKADAFLLIGKIYQVGGQDLPKSIEKAKEYYQKAVNEGSEEALSLLIEIDERAKSKFESEKYLKEIWSPPGPSTQKMLITDWDEIIACNSPDLKQQFIDALEESGQNQTPFTQIIIFHNDRFKSDLFFEPDGLLNKYVELVTKKQEGKSLVILVPKDKGAEERYLDHSWIPSLPQPLFEEFLKNQKPHFYTLTLEDQKLLKQKQLPEDLSRYIF